MGSSNLLGITVQYSMDGLKVGEDVVSDVRRKTRKLRRQDGVCRVSGLFREDMTRLIGFIRLSPLTPLLRYQCLHFIATSAHHLAHHAPKMRAKKPRVAASRADNRRWF